MKAPYDVNVLIELFVDQIKDGVEFGDAKNSPYTLTQTGNTAFIMLFKT